jgi:hypothetical protein
MSSPSPINVGIDVSKETLNSFNRKFAVKRLAGRQLLEPGCKSAAASFAVVALGENERDSAPRTRHSKSEIVNGK